MIKYKGLKEKSKELERKYKLNHYELLQRFMFERILERISVSKYQENFILKGGLLLSALFGIDNRTTRDMDTTIKGLNISKEKMINVLNEILNINLKDGVKFELIDITDIREDDDLDGIVSYDRIVNLWKGYAKKNKYAKDIKFEEIIRELKEFISSLDIEAVTV